MAPLATDPDEKHLSPLEGAMIKGHMEVWDILKDHIEMTVELKLEQLFYMIVTREYRNREECRTKFRELLSSIPVESVTWTSKGDPPVTRTLLQASYTYDFIERKWTIDIAPSPPTPLFWQFLA